MKRNKAPTGTIWRGVVRAAGILVLILGLAGCGSRAQLNLDPEGSGTAEIVVDLDPVFVAYFRDLSGAVGGEANMPIFDLSAISLHFSFVSDWKSI